MGDETAKAELQHPASSRSMGRRLGLAVAVFFFLTLGTGGLSSFLAWSILPSVDRILGASHHIEVIERIHATMHHVVREVDRAVIRRTLDREALIKELTGEVGGAIGTFLDEHLKEEPFPEREREINLLRVMERLYLQLDTATSSILASVAAQTQPRPEDLQILDSVAHQIGVLGPELNEIHHTKIRRLMAQGSRHMKGILGTNVTFLAIGSACLIAGIVLFSRTITLPLRRLASATLDIAAGDYGKRVPAASRDEIGQLSHFFNHMAEKLQRREAELQGAQAELSRRMLAIHTLSRIGVEISSTLELDKVLHSVVEKAQALLQSQGAILCLFRPKGAGLETRAVSGPVEAVGLKLDGGPPPCLTEPDGCLYPGWEPCSTCITLEGRPPAAGLAASLNRGDKVIGALCVGRKEARVFQPEERELLEGFAAQAAIAIENARLYKEVKGLATHQERERLAREMHDGLAQGVGYLHFQLKTLEERLEGGGQPPSSTELAEMRMATGKVYEDIRESIFGLRTSVSKGLGFIPILTEYLHEFSQKTGILVHLQREDERASQFSPETEVQLVRLIQEALTNVWKHAGARHAWVRFTLEGRRSCVTIADDGAGFAAQSHVGHDWGRFGLQTMRERVEGLGGSLEIRSTPGQGTQIVARVPVAERGTTLQ